MSTPQVSVVVSAYNLEIYIAQGLDSIAAQTFQNFECVIVNDGSTDKTQKIIEEYTKSDARFKVINKENGGVSTARNAGFDQITGKYVIFLDGDDFYEPNLIQRLYLSIKEKDADISVCNYRTFYESMQKFSDPRIDFKSFKKKSAVTYKTNPSDIFNVSTLMFWNKMFRTDFLREHDIRNDESLHRAQDIDFVGRALVEARAVAVVDEALVFYRTDTGTSNVSGLYKHPYDVVRSLQQLKDYLANKGIYEEVKKSYSIIAIDHILANLYFTEIYPVHKQIYLKAKKLLSGTVTVQAITEQELTDKKSYEDLKVLLNEDYESWLRYRIMDLRDDRESKYIAYLLEEFRRKYSEEVEAHQDEIQRRRAIEKSVSWRFTRPLRILHSKLRHPGDV